MDESNNSSFVSSYKDDTIEKKKSIHIMDEDEISIKTSLKNNTHDDLSIRSSHKSSKHDEVSLILPKSKIRKKPMTNKQSLLLAEKKSRNYATLGISFDLKGVSINDADSPKMVALKQAVKHYLLVKKDIYEKKKKAEDPEGSRVAPQYILANDLVGGKYSFETDIYRNQAERHSGLTIQEEDMLKEAYNRAQSALIDYISGKCIWFKVGRGRARLKQVKLIADMLQAENRRYALSELRSDLANSREAARYESTRGILPSYYGVIKNKDYIDKRHERLRKEGRNSSLHLGWYGALIKDMGNWGLSAYHIAGGTVFRALAVPTMIAGNALEFAGKTAKIAMKGLSMVTNGIFKLFRSQKRWDIKINKHTMTHGWVNLDSARVFNVNALITLLGTPVLTVKDTIHSLCRLVRNNVGPARVNKRVGEIWEDDFHRTRFIFGKLFTNIKKNIRSFFGAEKPISDRADAEYKEIRNGYQPGDDEDVDDDDD